MAASEDFRGNAKIETQELILSAGAQGGWCWTLYLVECMRGEHGIYETISDKNHVTRRNQCPSWSHPSLLRKFVP